MSLHNEIELENEISEHLAANGWLYSPNDDGYDRARALFPEDVLAWGQETQPKAWDAIVKNDDRGGRDQGNASTNRSAQSLRIFSATAKATERARVAHGTPSIIRPAVMVMVTVAVTE